MDGDGFISVEDLHQVFLDRNTQTSRNDLIAWVRKRDSSGSGAVNFRDFCEHYQ